VVYLSLSDLSSSDSLLLLFLLLIFFLWTRVKGEEFPALIQTPFVQIAVPLGYYDS
jgi:hypothetical protein